MVKNTPDSTPGLIPARRKSEDELDSNRAHKKPRTRVSYSCGECHRRKQKCDRQIPCSHCIARKVPELCKPYTPGKTDQDIHVRLARLEHIIETALPQYWSQGVATPNSEASGPHDRRRSMSPADDGNRSPAEDEDPSGGIFESGRWYGKSASGLVAAPAVLEQLRHMVPNQGPEREGSSSVNQLQSDIFKPDHKPGLAPMEQTAMERLQRLIQDCGYSSERLRTMYDELPPRKLRDELIDHYFTTINWTRYPISEHEFRASYAAFIANEHNHANPNNIRFLPLLFVVLAISVRLAPERIGGSEQTRKMAGSRYYWCSRRALLIIAAIQPDCFEIVLIRMLSARFLVLDRRMTESWSQLGAAVRTAQAIGLHRDGADMGMEPLQVERRRRIWSNLYHADRSIALVLGRPIAIHDSYTSTRPPSNIEEMTADGQFKVVPLSQPTRITFLILRHQLAEIMGRMSDFFQNVHSPRHYSDVLTLDDELLKYKQNLPSFFSLDPDTSHDQSHPYIPLQRFLLVTEFLFVRISLHRPYLLRKLNSTKYARSRSACFESALKDYEIRQEYFTTISRTGRDPVASAYREFQAAMIAGIYLVLYPKGQDAEKMHAVLDTFLERHERIPEMDDITRREMNIIEFLKTRSSQSAGTPESIARPKPSSDSRSYPVVGSSHLRPVAPKPPQNHALPTFSGPSYASVASVPISTSSQQSYAQLSRPSPIQQVQHLQQSESASHSGTGSPGGEEDSTAQSLLDQWCNIFSGGPAVDDIPSGTGLPWATPGLADLSGWTGANPSAASTSPAVGSDALPNVDGSDWSYWETLVNQIRSGPVS
ncbi:fungal-specific transcription factor domain-containing protein [Trametes punicea]|nr:fungal-specific transcription factor domain-containing protein [Trametes punicea]